MTPFPRVLPLSWAHRIACSQDDEVEREPEADVEVEEEDDEEDGDGEQVSVHIPSRVSDDVTNYDLVCFSHLDYQW